MPEKFTTEVWVSKAEDVHGDRFDYSLVDYKGSLTEVTITCKKHEYSFQYTPKQHLKTISGGCKLCDKERKIVIAAVRPLPKKYRKSTEQYIKESKTLHGDKYSYDRCVYLGTHKTVELYCNTCKEYFKTYAGDHIKIGKACGCPACGLANRKPRVSKTTYDKLVEKVKDKWESFGYTDFKQYIIENDRE